MRSLQECCAAIIGWCRRLPSESHTDRSLRLLVSAVVLLFPATCLLVDRSDSLSLLLLAIIGLLVWVRNSFRSGLTRRDWLFVVVFAGFFLAGVLAFELGHQTDDGFRLLGRYLRFLFVLPVLLALRRYQPPAAVVWAGLGLGAAVLGLDAVWESVAAGGFLRPDGDTNVAILFGDMATLTTFAFAAGYIYVDERLPRAGPWLVGACVLLGLLASFLSGTRGAWIAMPVLLVLFLSCRHLLRPRIVLVGAGMLAVVFMLLVTLPQTHIGQRIGNIVRQIQVYRVITQSGSDLATAGQCADDPRILQSWANDVIADQPGKLKIDVVPVKAEDMRPLANYGCTRGVAVHLRNDTKDTSWVEFHRYNFYAKGMVTSRWMVKGNADMKFAGNTAAVRRVQTPKFGPVKFWGPAKDAFLMTVVVPPGDDILIVPLESRFGEYRYAILESPVGQRLEMWAASLQLYGKAPVFGVGTGAYQTETHKLVTTGEALPDAAEYDHPHSDYFDALSSRGLVGFLALLLLLGLPAWIYSRGIDSRDPHCMGAALGGLLVAAGFAIFGLTETMFIHSVTIGWYVIMTSVFLVSMDAPRGQGIAKR